MVDVELTEGEVLLISGMLEHELENLQKVESRLEPHVLSTMDQVFASLSIKMALALDELGVDPL
jgi:hypothetical protein